jgi:hypothetical protein
VDDEVAVPSVGPSSHGQQGRAAQSYRSQYLVPEQGVQSVFPVHLQGQAAVIGRHASTEGVSDDLAASQNAKGGL